MFGVVPKVLWSKLNVPDESNRVSLSCNLLLIKTESKMVLIETGMGARWTEQEIARYDLRACVDYANILQGAGITHDDVDYVLLSHLHFDHAGGAVTRRPDGSLVPTFARAKYVVQKGEWEFAHQANARARGSYRSDDFDPLLRDGVLQLVEGDVEITPGIQLKVTGGHTSHHQVVLFHSGGKTGVYFADIIPTCSHLQPPWTMGYDHFPLASCDAKAEYLKKAAEESWLVVFDHESGTPWGQVTLQENGKFQWHPLTV